MGINSWVGVGRITKDIELRYTQSNLAVAKFTIAIDRKYKGDNAERATDYIQVVVWRQAAENVSKYCSKGSLVGITGAIQTGSYDDKDGKRVYTTEINADSVQFLDSKKQDNGMAPQFNQEQKDYDNKEVDVFDGIPENERPY